LLKSDKVNRIFEMYGSCLTLLLQKQYCN